MMSSSGGEIINGVGRMKNDAQPWAQLLTAGAGQRRLQQGREFRLVSVSRKMSGSLIVFSPRSTILFLSKSFTRPAGTSARP